MKIVITVKDTDNVIGLKEDIAMRLEGKRRTKNDRP